MRILVIEDDDNKRQQLVEFLSLTFSQLTVTEARSYNSGLRALLAGKYDHVFLDMTMPTFDRSPTEDGGRIRPFAGKDILLQISRRQVATRIVIFTQFGILGEGNEQISLQDLDTELKRLFGKVYVGYVHYDTALNDWQNKVNELITTTPPAANL